jgi:hypothetical protein
MLGFQDRAPREEYRPQPLKGLEMPNFGRPISAYQTLSPDARQAGGEEVQSLNSGWVMVSGDGAGHRIPFRAAQRIDELNLCKKLSWRKNHRIADSQIHNHNNRTSSDLPCGCARATAHSFLHFTLFILFSCALPRPNRT